MCKWTDRIEQNIKPQVKPFVINRLNGDKLILGMEQRIEE